MNRIALTLALAAAPLALSWAAETKPAAAASAPVPKVVQGVKLAGLCSTCAVVTNVKSERRQGDASGVGAVGGAAGKITVRSVALADVLAGLPGGVCDFLKMDCEGAEYDMLLNLDDAAWGRIRRISGHIANSISSPRSAELE